MPLKTQELSYADRVIREALLATANGLDCEVAVEAIDDMLHAWAKAAKELKALQPTKKVVKATCVCGNVLRVEAGIDVELLARASGQMAKGMNEVVRLVAFTKGQPDSRPDGGRDSRDVLKLLTDEQMAQVTAWVEANQAR